MSIGPMAKPMPSAVSTASTVRTVRNSKSRSGPKYSE